MNSREARVIRLALRLLRHHDADADSQVFCYSNADIRKGEEAEEIFRFIKFWTRQYGSHGCSTLYTDSVKQQSLTI